MDSSSEEVCSEMGACFPGSSRRGSDSIMMLSEAGSEREETTGRGQLKSFSGEGRTLRVNGLGEESEQPSPDGDRAA